MSSAPPVSSPPPIWSDSQLSMRVGATQEAIKRARFAFFLCILAASASFICLWNTYLSEDREFAFMGTRAMGSTYALERGSKEELAAMPDERWWLDCPNDKTPQEDECEPGRQNMREMVRQELVKNWLQGQFITINLLGIRVSVGDFTVLDSLGISVFVFYALLALRRENHEVGQLFGDISNLTYGRSDKSARFLREAVYFSISGYMVFNLGEDDRVYSRLPVPENGAAKERNRRGRRNERIRWIRVAVKLLAWMPLLVVVFMVVCDLASLFAHPPDSFSSPFRVGTIWSGMKTTSDKLQELSPDLFAGFVAFLVYRLTIHGSRFQDGTRLVLDTFKDGLAKDAAD